MAATAGSQHVTSSRRPGGLGVHYQGGVDQVAPLRVCSGSLQDQSARLVELADELIACSRKRITAQRARLEHNHELMLRHHRWLAAIPGARSDATRRRNVEREVAQLRKALESRATIDQAKGIVMADRRCDADEAFRVLVKVSQDSNVKLRDVADLLVCRAQGQEGPTPG